MESLALLIGIGVIVVVLLIALIVLMRSFRIASPSEALIITGRGASKEDVDGNSRVIIGGRVVVYPIVQRAFTLSLSSRQIAVEIDGISKNGIALRLRGVAQVKVGGTEGDVRKAAQRFLDQQDQIDHYSQEILSGTLRAVVGTLTVEQIIQDRASFASQVQNEAEHSMNNQGLVIDTFQISAVEDEGSYLRDWGRPQAALVAKHAAIAESNASREAEEARNIDAQRVAESRQTYDLRQAEIKEQTDARQAIADAAGPLSRAAEKQKIIEQDQRIATGNAKLREEQLVSEVNRPAEAKRYAAEQEADARKYERIADSQAELEDQRNRAEAQKVAADAEAVTIERRGVAQAEIELQRRSKEAEAVRLEGEADAAAVSARGKAEAEALLARGSAEAESTRQKAEAYREFTDAAVLDQVLSVLPQIAKELASPYSNIKDLSVVSTDGESKIGKSIASSMGQVLEMVRGTTGIDLSTSIQQALSSDSVAARKSAGRSESSDDSLQDDAPPTD